MLKRLRMQDAFPSEYTGLIKVNLELVWKAEFQVWTCFEPDIHFILTEYSRQPTKTVFFLKILSTENKAFGIVNLGFHPVSDLEMRSWIPNFQN
jgi:hypothetical protein